MVFIGKTRKRRILTHKFNKTNKIHNLNKNRNNNISIYKRLNEKDLIYVGKGSYGLIYSLPSSHMNKVIKIHSITNKEDNKCISWEKEYNLHKNVYSQCTPLFETLHIPINIVKPYYFTYGFQTNASIESKNNEKGANICYFSMERIYGMIYFERSTPNNKTKLIQNKIKNNKNLNFNTDSIPLRYGINYTEYYNDTPHLNNTMIQQMERLLQVPYTSYLYHIYPYHVFLGTTQPSNDQITLPALKGATIIPLYRDEIQYCICEGLALEYMYQMMLSFFVLVSQGFAPRDIEYVLYGNNLDYTLSIIDFNEADTIKERQLYNGETYNLAEDIGHIYIDICGVRKSREEKNPQIPYNHGTPSWKFLSNPLASPQAFFICIHRVKETLQHIQHNIPFDDIIHIIYNYIYNTYFKITKQKFHTQFSHLKDWKPLPYFSHNNSSENDIEFDKEFQKYIILKLCETLILQKKIKVEDIDEFLTMDYLQLLDIFQRLHNKKKYIIDDSEDMFTQWL